MNTLPLIWMAVLFATAVPGFTPKARMQAKGFSSLPEEDKTVRNPDPRVEKALKKLGLKYKVDENGDFYLVLALEDNRTQVVIISSTTATLGKMEIREVWSPIAKFASTPPCELSLELLEKHSTFKIGSYQYKKLRSGSYLLVLIVHLSAKAPAEELGSIVRAVARTADETEIAIVGNDDF
jgi:hypothetical protein